MEDTAGAMAPQVTLRAVPAPAPQATGEVTLESAFREHSLYVARVAQRLLGSRDDADDVVQDVFLAAWRGLRSLKDSDSARPWLATITVRFARRKLRRRRLRTFFGLDSVAEEELPVAPGASADDKAMLRRIYAVLDGLPVADRLAWVLRHMEGEKLESVADLCGCSLATAKRRIAAAQQALEEVLGHD